MCIRIQQETLATTTLTATKNVEKAIGWKEQNNNSVRALNIILALFFAITVREIYGWRKLRKTNLDAVPKN